MTIDKAVEANTVLLATQNDETNPMCARRPAARREGESPSREGVASLSTARRMAGAGTFLGDAHSVSGGATRHHSVWYPARARPAAIGTRRAKAPARRGSYDIDNLLSISQAVEPGCKGFQTLCGVCAEQLVYVRSKFFLHLLSADGILRAAATVPHFASEASAVGGQHGDAGRVPKGGASTFDLGVDGGTSIGARVPKARLRPADQRRRSFRKRDDFA